MKTRVLAAMSGGVDSSVAAALLVERGYDAIGVTLKLLPRGETGFGCCGSPADVDDAKRVCERLGIVHYVMDMSELFESAVIRPYVEAYLSARTPNPCVECNRRVKFGHLLGLAQAWGCSAVATGHYARVENGLLLKARDPHKDQSYFLYSLTRKELGRVLFPVGDMSKDAVRDKARELGLKTADKPESQETCFVPNRDVRGFVASRAGEEALAAGEIRSTSGERLGRHSGLAGYTVGQRKGLGLSSPEPLYVVRMDGQDNALIVGREDEAQADSLLAGDLSWTQDAPAASFRAEARVRHRHPPAPAWVEPRPEGTVRVRFDALQRAPAPGQAVVFYDGETVLGGGTILGGGAP